MAGNFNLPTENIDEVILRLLALEPNEIDELDYETYKQYLKELLVEIDRGRKVDSSEVELVREDFKKIRGKKGRFKIKSQKSKISTSKLGLGSIRDKTKIVNQRLLLSPSKGISNQDDSVVKKPDNDSNPLLSISKTLDNILNTLININNQNKNKLNIDRRNSENASRNIREKELESKNFDGIKKVVGAIVKPFQSIWDRILNFITSIVLGKILIKLIDWIADKKNQDKIKSLIRFFKDHWPVLLAIYLRFGTGIGRFIGKITGFLARGAIKLAAITANFASRLGFKKLGKLGRFLGGRGGRVLGGALTVGANVAGVLGASSVAEGVSNGEFKIPFFSGGGWSGGFKNFFGNMFSGLVKGPKGRDKVPAMLTDGEFVMSAGAVRKYGVDTLEGMNAAGGGTNIPQIANGTTYAEGGGYIGNAITHLKEDEALSSLTRGMNDFIRPGKTSIKSGKKWNSVLPNTPIHAYIDSVGKPTIGWGSTYYDSILNGKKPVKPGDTITKSQADNIFKTNVTNLSLEYSKRIPTWNKMSNDQKTGLLLVGYNAPTAPIGTYKNLTSSLAKGDMVTAASESHRGGPSPTRLALEKKLLLSGPKDLSKVKEEVKPKPSSTPTKMKSNSNQNNSGNWFSNLTGFFGLNRNKNNKYKDGGMIGEDSGSNYGPDGKKLSGADRQYFSYFAQPGESRYVFTKKATDRGAIDLANMIQALLDSNSKAAKDGHNTISSDTNTHPNVKSANISRNQTRKLQVNPPTKSKSHNLNVISGGVNSKGISRNINNPQNRQELRIMNPNHPKGTRIAHATLGVKR